MMTYKSFKNLVSGLLVGDNVLPGGSPDKDEVLSGLVDYALLTVATQADSLHLMTLNASVDVLRLGQGDYLVRKPVAPILDNDTVDIDDELVPAVARYVASYLSKDKGGIHVNAANRIIKDYNSKTWEVIEQVQVEMLDRAPILEGDTCYTPDTTFNAACGEV